MRRRGWIVRAKYYQDVSEDLIKGATLVLDKYKKFKTTHDIEYKILYAPGVFEIPYVVSCNINNFDAFIALAVVIKGETPHFDFISNAATNGIMNLSINHQKPIINGIVTCLNKEQAKDRCKTDRKNKGGEAAKALLHLLGISKDHNEAK